MLLQLLFVVHFEPVLCGCYVQVKSFVFSCDVTFALLLVMLTLDFDLISPLMLVLNCLPRKFFSLCFHVDLFLAKDLLSTL